MANRKKKRPINPFKDAKMLVQTPTVMVMTNAKEVAKWKETYPGSGELVFDRIVKL